MRSKTGNADGRSGSHKSSCPSLFRKGCPRFLRQKVFRAQQGNRPGRPATRQAGARLWTRAAVPGGWRSLPRWSLVRSRLGCSWPALQLQSADALELADVVCDERETAGQSLSGDEQVIRPDGCAMTFEFRANVRGGFRSGTVQRQFNDGRDEPLDFLPLLRRVLSFRKSAEQLIDADH